MKTYIAPITVTESGAVIVQAESKDQARKLVRGEYNNEKTKWIDGEVQIRYAYEYNDEFAIKFELR